MNLTIFKSLDGRYFCITDGKIIEIKGQQSKEHLTSAAAETVSVVNDKPQSQRDDSTETEVGLCKIPDSEKTTLIQGKMRILQKEDLEKTRNLNSTTTV